MKPIKDNPVIFLIILIPLLILSCTVDGSQIKGDGNVISQSHSPGFFNSIEASGMFNIILEPGQVGQVIIETDSNLHDHITIETIDGTLRIQSLRESMLRPTKMNLYITYPELSRIQVGGACKISSPVLFSGSSLTYDISGAASIDMEIDVQNLYTTIAGAGDIHLQGRAGHHRLELSGASNLKAQKLLTTSTDLTMSGAGSASVHASDELSATISGIGSVKYYGNPKNTSFQKSGIGSIKPGE